MQASLIERPKGELSVATGTARNDRGRRKKTVTAGPATISTIPAVSEAPMSSAAIDAEKCPRLGPDGRCNGLYYGFLCIKDKCQMPNRESACEFCIGGDYCIKYNRFGCVGPQNCGTKDDYLSYIRKAREKAEAYQ